MRPPTPEIKSPKLSWRLRLIRSTARGFCSEGGVQPPNACSIIDAAANTLNSQKAGQNLYADW
jgi:hypothetical protein